MQSTASRWIATGAIALAVVSVGALHAFTREAGTHRERSQDASQPPPPPAAVAAAPSATPGSASPQPARSAPAQPGEPADMPTVRLPCVDDRTELQTRPSSPAGSLEPVLCWGEHCIAKSGDPVATPPGPAAVVEAVVGPDQVCTGARCDALGPRLRSVLAKPEPDRRLSATRDHAAIVIQHEFAAEAWNRALDRPIHVGTSPLENWIDGTFDTTPESIHVIGDSLLVAWSCYEFCSAMATVLDARGRPTRSPDLPIQPIAVRRGRFDSVVAVSDDRFFVFGLFGELAMISHGRVVAQDALQRTGTPGEIRLIQTQVVREDANPGSGAVDVLWCDDSRCEVTRITGRSDHQRWSLTFDRDFALPLCPTSR